MKRLQIYLVVFLVGALVFARAIDIPAHFPTQFTTISGQTFHKVTISAVDDTGVTIMHDSGVSKIDFTNLPPDLQKLFKFNAKKTDLAVQKEKYEQEIAQLQDQVTQLQLALVKSQDQVTNLTAQLRATNPTGFGQAAPVPRGLANPDVVPSLGPGDLSGVAPPVGPLKW